MRGPGGDGRTNFGIPDLRGRVTMNNGTGPGLSPRPIGQKSGTESNTLNVAELPNHNHEIATTSAAPDTHNPSGSIFATFPGTNDIYSVAGTADGHMRIDAVTNTGGGQSVNNMQPYLVITYCVAVTGVYPSKP